MNPQKSLQREIKTETIWKYKNTKNATNRLHERRKFQRIISPQNCKFGAEH